MQVNVRSGPGWWQREEHQQAQQDSCSPAGLRLSAQLVLDLLFVFKPFIVKVHSRSPAIWRFLSAEFEF
jgi:hypothetical protein